jgi:D-alanyl-D-alanine carboxypeptidase/D-alanyl-D-alanine-endopeptidase (penicillin-binding protein 4)
MVGLFAAQPAIASPQSGAGEREFRVGPDLAGRTAVVRSEDKAARRGGVGHRRLAREVGSLIDQAGSGSGVWIGRTGEAGASKVLGRRAEAARILASNTKLFTTAAALDRLGPRKRLRTRVVTGGEIEAGTLHGNLFLVGDGDPALAGRSFARRHGLAATPLGRLARQVRKAGVKRVSGDLLADDTVFDRVRGVPDSGGATSRYIGPLSGLSYNQNRSGSGFVGEPAIRAAQTLRGGLAKRGVKIAGKVALREAPEELFTGPPLAVVRSPRIRELVEQTNRPSNNFFAEMLLKRLDASYGERGTTKGGTIRVERFASELGSGVQAADGSGLTRSNRASPEQVGKLLVAMRDHEASHAFKRSLPKAGRQGTVAGRMRGTAAEGRCRAKTGTISGVSALSGYCRAKRGEMAFSILMNGADVYRARQLQDRIAALIARYRG